MGNKTIEPRRYLFAVNHPSQFHMFKNLARKLLDDGHHCVFFIQQRGIIEDLVKGCGFEYRFAISPFWREKLKGRIGIFLRGVVHLVQSRCRGSGRQTSAWERTAQSSGWVLLAY